MQEIIGQIGMDGALWIGLGIVGLLVIGMIRNSLRLSVNRFGRKVR